MARARFLPKYVTRFVDRHGKERLRFRRVGSPSHYFKAPLGTEEFRVEYRACMDRVPAPAKERAPIIVGSVNDLLASYYAVPERLGPSAATQSKVRAALEKFREGRGDKSVKAIRFDHVERIIAKRKVQTMSDKGRPVGGPEAARKLRKELIRLFDYAIRLGWIMTNPAKMAAQVKIAPEERSTGFHSWSEDEIAQYQAHHPIGSMARLALELILWTGQRRGDAIKMLREDARDGAIELRQRKGGKPLILPMAEPLQKALVATSSPAATILATSHGQPFSDAGFGNWFRDQCDAAGLKHCTSHGLRKAALRRLAEAGASQQELKAVSGHSGDDEVATYTRGANQKVLATSALARAEKRFVSNRGARKTSNLPSRH